jgi:hypothetical protein
MFLPLLIYLHCRLRQPLSLLVPALGAIGPGSCIGMTGRWKDYPWFAAIVLASIMFLFLSHLSSQQYVDRNYGYVSLSLRVHTRKFS